MMEELKNGLKRPLNQDASDQTSKRRRDESIQQPTPRRPYGSQYLNSQGLASLNSWLESVSEPLGNGTPPRLCHSAPALMDHKGKEPIPRAGSSSSTSTRMPPPSAPSSSPRRQMYIPQSSPRPSSPASSRSPSTSLVQVPTYRDRNLLYNGISAENLNAYLSDPLPPVPSAMVSQARRLRDSPEPSWDEVQCDNELLTLMDGAPESSVENVIKEHFLPKPGSYICETLRRDERLPMNKEHVPDGKDPLYDYAPSLPLSRPVPDMLYGYARNTSSFSRAQFAFLDSQGSHDDGLSNSSGLTFPFFVIEAKGDSRGGGTGSCMYVATNQCLGASATCVAIMESLNKQLLESSRITGSAVRQTNSATWSMAVDNSMARLYISWRGDDLTTYTRGVDNFILQKPDDYMRLRRHMRNILEWGRTDRLQDIRECIDRLIEEARLQISQRAKSRPAPLDESGGGSPSRSMRRVSEAERGRQRSGSSRN